MSKRKRREQARAEAAAHNFQEILDELDAADDAAIAAEDVVAALEEADARQRKRWQFMILGFLLAPVAILIAIPSFVIAIAFVCTRGTR